VRTSSARAIWDYTVVEVDVILRIAELTSSRTALPPLEGSPPVMDAATREAWLAGTSLDAPLSPLAEEMVPNGDHAFTEGPIAGTPLTLSVERVGKLSLRSGVLAVADPTSIPGLIAPLRRRVAPTEAPVEVSIDSNGVVVAVRVVFEPSRRASAFREATDTRGGFGLGVDSATAAVFDADSFSRLSEWQRQQLATDGFGDAERGALRALCAPNDCFVVHSGDGDGSYPAYWGVDAEGEIVFLQIDFVAVGGDD
jgi:hypothetical protein